MLNHLPPAVATMSLGVPVGQWSRSLDSAVTSLINQAQARPCNLPSSPIWKPNTSAFSCLVTVTHLLTIPHAGMVSSSASDCKDSRLKQYSPARRSQ